MCIPPPPKTNIIPEQITVGRRHSFLRLSLFTGHINFLVYISTYVYLYVYMDIYIYIDTRME